MTDDTTRSEVQRFYDGFFESRMLSYRIDGPNKRLQRAVDRVVQFAPPTGTVLDLGCGIGIVDEQVYRRVGSGIRIWACDLSPRNIAFASKTIRANGIRFFVADILDDFATIAERVGSADLITLIDVIEHVPDHRRGDLFRNIAGLCKPGTRVVLTYPSPEYQQYLRQHKPSELQIIDESIDVQEITRCGLIGGFRLKHYRLEDVWMTNQYVHAVLEFNSHLVDVMPPKPSLPQRVLDRLKGTLRGQIVKPYRRRKYITDLCTESPVTRLRVEPL